MPAAGGKAFALATPPPPTYDHDDDDNDEDDDTSSYTEAFHLLIPPICSHSMGS